MAQIIKLNHVGPRGVRGETGVGGGNGGNTYQEHIYGEALAEGTPVRVVDDGGVSKVKSLATEFVTPDLQHTAQSGDVTNQFIAKVNENVFVTAYREGDLNKIRLIKYDEDNVATFGPALTINSSLDTIVGLQVGKNPEKLLVFADNNYYQLFFINFQTSGITISTNSNVFLLEDRQPGSGMLVTDNVDTERVFPILHAAHQFVLFYKNTSNQLAFNIVDMRSNTEPEFTSISFNNSFGANSNVISKNAPSYINVRRVNDNRAIIMWCDSVTNTVKAMIGEYDSIGRNIRLQKTVDYPYTIYNGAATKVTLLPVTNNKLNDNLALFIYTKDGGAVEGVLAKITNPNKIVPFGERVIIESSSLFNRMLDAERIVANRGLNNDYGIVAVSSNEELKLIVLSVVEDKVKIHKTISEAMTTTPTAEQNFILRKGELDYIIAAKSSDILQWSVRVNEFSKEDFYGIAQESGLEGTTGTIATAGTVSTVPTNIPIGSFVHMNTIGDITTNKNGIQIGLVVDTNKMMVDYAPGKTPLNIRTVGYGDGFDYKVERGTVNAQIPIQAALKEIALLGGGTVHIGPGVFKIDRPIFMLGSNVRLMGSGIDVTQIYLNDYMDMDGICGGDGFGTYTDYGEDSGIFSRTDNQWVSDMTIEGNMYRQSTVPVREAKKTAGLISIAATRNLLRLRMDAMNSYFGGCERVKFQNGIQNGISIESVLHYNVRDCYAYNCAFNFYQEFDSHVNITNCHSQHARNSGFRAFSTSESIYTNCISRSDDGSAFSHQGGTQITYQGCIAHRPGWHADEHNVSSSGFQISSLNGIPTKWDKIIGCAINAAQGSGIVLNGAWEREIIANSFSRNGQIEDLTNNDIILSGSNNNNNTFISNTFDNSAPTYYQNRARYNIVSTGANTGNVFLGNKPGPAALGFMFGFDEMLAGDNTRQIFHGDTYMGGSLKLQGNQTTELTIKTSGDLNEARILRSAATGKVELFNKVAGPQQPSRSMNFSSGSGHVTVPSNAALNLGTSFTLSWWAKTANFTGDRYFFHRNEYSCSVVSNKKMRFTLHGVIDIADNGPLTISDNVWTHLAIKHEAGTYKFYYNGVLSGTRTIANEPPSTTNNWRIGGNGGTSVWGGLADDPRIYTVALSDSDIALLATGGDPSTAPALHLPFNEGTGTSARDLSPNALHGTLVNSPTWSTDVPSQDPGKTLQDIEVSVMRSEDSSEAGIYGKQTFGEPAGLTTIEGARSIIKNAMIPKVASATTPPAGYVRIYSKTSVGKLYAKDEAGVEYDLTVGGGGATVDSVNGETGVVVLDADDISDSSTTKKFSNATEKAKLANITVTGAVDLDTINTRVNDLDAAVILRGVWDASAGTFPGGGTAQAGSSYIVSVGGTVGGTAFSVGDRIIAITDNASTSTFASNWFKADYTDQVSSVAGQTGTVVLAKSDVGLGNVDNVADANKPVSVDQLATIIALG